MFLSDPNYRTKEEDLFRNYRGFFVYYCWVKCMEVGEGNGELCGPSCKWTCFQEDVQTFVIAMTICVVERMSLYHHMVISPDVVIF
jgi:hypothetical protein